MKNFLLIVIITFGLVGCDRIGSFISTQIDKYTPTSSIEQDQKAAQLYRALQLRQTKVILSLIDGPAKVDFEKFSPEEIKTFIQLVPEQQPTSMDIINTSKTVSTETGKLTSVVYRYTYPDRYIDFSVAFDGHDASEKIMIFGIYQTMDKDAADNSEPASVAVPEASAVATDTPDQTQAAKMTI
ncbi:hypothetical protein EC844_10965 [Acinetobacter calcoaceticus]|uniref:Lipoprotein n=1 Tax=Acinetobacter calcoaceticus TaxID=471 RepID=A0A4R1Y5B4_ACICA|nr:hypothetical protein EC844_10965 [Acinetobacter calcoaceticus]